MNQAPLLTKNELSIISELLATATAGLGITTEDYQTDPTLRSVYNQYERVIGEASVVKRQDVEDLLKVYADSFKRQKRTEKTAIAYHCLRDIYAIFAGQKSVEGGTEFSDAKSNNLKYADDLEFWDLSPRSRKAREEKGNAPKSYLAALPVMKKEEAAPDQGTTAPVTTAPVTTAPNTSGPGTTDPVTTDKDVKDKGSELAPARREILIRVMRSIHGLLDLHERDFNYANVSYQNYRNLSKGMNTRPKTVQELIAGFGALIQKSSRLEEYRQLAAQYLALTKLPDEEAQAGLEELDKQKAELLRRIRGPNVTPAHVKKTDRKEPKANIREPIRSRHVQPAPSDYINAALNLYGGMTGLSPNDFIFESRHGPMPVLFAHFFDAADNMKSLPDDKLLALTDALELRIPDLKFKDPQKHLAGEVLDFIRGMASGGNIASPGDRLKSLIEEARQLGLEQWTNGINRKGKAGWVKELAPPRTER